MTARVSHALCIAAFLALAGTAQAATLRVGRGRPHATIASAVAAAAPGDTIVVGKGRYVETVQIDVAGVTLRAARGVEWQPGTWRESCVVVGPEGTNTTVQGFLFRGAGSAIASTADGLSVVKCRFRGNSLALEATGDAVSVTKCDIAQSDSAINITGHAARVERTSALGTRSTSVRISGDDALVARCTVRRVDDDPPISVVGDRAHVERNRVGITEEEGIRVHGNDASITRNEIRATTHDGISVVGSGALIERNELRSCRDNGIHVEGDACVVRDNRVEDVLAAQGVFVVGDDALVEGNTVAGLSRSDGIHVDGRAFAVVGNQVLDVGYAGSGIFVSGEEGGAQSPRVADNVVVGSSGDGIRVLAPGVTVSGNRVEQCSRSGIYVFGPGGALLQRNVVTDVGENGCLFEAPDTHATDCVVSGSGGDGYRVAPSATGIEITACRASDCAADGLHNSGVATFTDCTLTNNRQDVANDGTLTDGGGNRYTTGGVDAAPVD